MTEVKAFLSQPLSRLVAICLLPLALFPLLQYLAVARYGSVSFLWCELIMLLPFLAALLALVVAPFLFLIRRVRPFAIRLLVAAVVLVVSVFVGLRLGGSVRMAAFHGLAKRSAPLVQAIRSYEIRHGAPPPALADLVPEFLPSIPSTGMAAYPSYTYFVGERATRFNGNPWALFIFTPSGGINFDSFIYLPLQNYPKHGFGGSLETVSDWAYVHE